MSSGQPDNKQLRRRNLQNKTSAHLPIFRASSSGGRGTDMGQHEMRQGKNNSLAAQAEDRLATPE
jgi:hypothetical protein